MLGNVVRYFCHWGREVEGKMANVGRVRKCVNDVEGLREKIQRTLQGGEQRHKHKGTDGSIRTEKIEILSFASTMPMEPHHMRERRRSWTSAIASAAL